MFPTLKKKVFSFLVGEEGKISKQSLLSLSAFLGASALVGSLSAKSVHADACGDGGGGGACGDACGDSGDSASGDTGGACGGGTGHASHINDLTVGYAGGTASATHTHHSSG